jgi:peroxiredoxin
MISRIHSGPALLTLCAFLMFASLGHAAPPGLVGKPAPDFALKGLDGKNLRLSEYQGQVVLVNFWARWAGASRAEMPALNRINETYGRAGLVVLGISIDEDLQRAREFATTMHVSYPMLFDTGETIGREYQLENLPFTVLIDRTGTIRFVNAGFKRGDEQSYVDQIRELLRE